MIHITVPLGQCTVEVRNQDEAIVFVSLGNQELLRLSFNDFDQILEAVARSESFATAMR